MSFFREIGKNTKMHMEVQKTLNSPNNPEQKEQMQRYHNA
jgi:hypothetical protein